jgi:DNA-binding NtrC family response regulator
MTHEITVLHVDDNPALLDLTAELLERADTGITVLSESDPTAVPIRIATESIDCVVSDYEMPDCDGLELCHHVRRDHPHLPFFLFTGMGGRELVSEAMAAGVTDYIQKQPGVEQYTLLANRIINAVLFHRARERIVELEALVQVDFTA